MCRHGPEWLFGASFLKLNVYSKKLSAKSALHKFLSRSCEEINSGLCCGYIPFARIKTRCGLVNHRLRIFSYNYQKLPPLSQYYDDEFYQ